MADQVAKLFVTVFAKLLTPEFLSRVLYYIVKSWAKQTDNQIDDKIAEAIADAYGLPKEALNG